MLRAEFSMPKSALLVKKEHDAIASEKLIFLIMMLLTSFRSD